MKRGNRGFGVKTRQIWLRKYGFYFGKIDGVYGLQTEKAVRAFQTKAKIFVDGIIGPQTESAMKNWGRTPTRIVRRIKDFALKLIVKKHWDNIVIHYSASPYNYTSPEVICKWHRARGFIKGGYHILVQPGGMYETGDQYPKWLRKSDEIGAHSKGHNINSFGICYIGNDRPTPQQFDTIVRLVKDLKAQGHGNKRILAHKEWPYPTRCCPIDMDRLRKAT